MNLKDWEVLEGSIKAFGEELEKNKNREKKKMELKDLEKAIWNVNMKMQGKNIRYLERGELLELAEKKVEDGGLNAAEFEQYKTDIQNLLEVRNLVEKKEAQSKLNEHRMNVEGAINKATDYMIKQQMKKPINERLPENQIRLDIKGIANRWSGYGSDEYKEKLREHCGTGLSFEEPSRDDVLIEKGKALLGIDKE